MDFATLQRNLYREAVNNANAYYRETQDLQGFQSRNRAARDEWETNIRDYYRNPELEQQIRDALNNGFRVYAELGNNVRMSVYSVPSLYAVSDTTGAPAQPLIARMQGLTVSDKTLMDFIRPA